MKAFPRHHTPANRVESNGSKPLLAVTMGDPCGIGAEVIVKALAVPNVREQGRFVILGIERRLQEAALLANVKPFWFRVDHRDPLRVDSGVVVIDYPEYADTDWRVPRPCRTGGAASLQFLDAAVALALGDAVDAIVTAPIHKGSWKLAGCPWPGHTEKLADACRASRVTMMFAADDLRVALASTHLGLFELRNHFSLGLVFQPIELLHQALREWFAIETPRIAVAGLNPHAGEDGQFGDEECRVIEPAMRMARNLGIDVQGPFPADSLFTARRRASFDGIVAMYHDQGLIPVKMFGFDRAVNVTLGLPIIRTGVSHGTAYDIAGANRADAGSMKEAIRMALQFARRRKSVVRDACTANAGARS